MKKEINRNIAESLLSEQIGKDENKKKRKNLSRAKARAGRIKADKRNKK